MKTCSLVNSKLVDLLAQNLLSVDHELERMLASILLGSEEATSSVVSWLRKLGIKNMWRTRLIIELYIKSFLEFRKNGADSIDAVDCFYRKQVQFFPCFIQLGDIRQTQVAFSQWPFFEPLNEALDALQRTFEFESKRSQDQIKPQKQAELPACPLSFSDRAVQINLCNGALVGNRRRADRAPISDCGSAERDHCRHEGLPLCKFETWSVSRNHNRNDQEYSDGAGRSCEPIKVHPLNLRFSKVQPHGGKLTPQAAFVEGVAA